jgi:hypothetical protein
MSKKKCLIALTLGVKVMTLFVFATYGVTTEARVIETLQAFPALSTLVGYARIFP